MLVPSGADKCMMTSYVSITSVYLSADAKLMLCGENEVYYVLLSMPMSTLETQALLGDDSLILAQK